MEITVDKLLKAINALHEARILMSQSNVPGWGSVSAKCVMAAIDLETAIGREPVSILEH